MKQVIQVTTSVNHACWHRCLCLGDHWCLDYQTIFSNTIVCFNVNAHLMW